MFYKKNSMSQCLFNSNLLLFIVLKYMFKEKRRGIKHWGNLTKKLYLYK